MPRTAAEAVPSSAWVGLQHEAAGFWTFENDHKRARPLGETLQWVAPEVFQQNNVLAALPKACDICSFGRIAYALFTGARDVRDEGAMLRALRRGDVAPLICPITALQNKFTSKCAPILDRCCFPDASAIPDIAEVAMVEAQRKLVVDENLEDMLLSVVDILQKAATFVSSSPSVPKLVERAWQTLWTSTAPQFFVGSSPGEKQLILAMGAAVAANEER